MRGHANRGDPRICRAGASGAGKTRLAEAVSRASGWPVEHLDGAGVLGHPTPPEFFSGRLAVATAHPRCILLLDQLDSLCPAADDGGMGVVERGLVAHVVAELDRLTAPGHAVFIIATTSLTGTVDPAILRAGRLSLRIEVPVPSPSQRREIIESILPATRCSPAERKALVLELVGATPGCTPTLHAPERGR